MSYIGFDPEMADEVLEKLHKAEARIKELEKEVDSVKLNSGYVAFMESQARIKELERKCDILENKITELEDELDEKG